MGQKRLLGLVIALVIIGGFILWRFKLGVTFQPSPSPTSVATASATVTSIKSFDLVIKNKLLVSGPDTLKVSQGDQVVINITSDVDENFHLHGYDKEVGLKAATPAQLQLQADIAGRFTYELEDSKTEIGALEVIPK